MFIVIVSSCTYKSKKRTRHIVDQYATRIAENTWQTSITQAGLQQLHSDLKINSSKNTAITCFVNNGYKKLTKLWEVGSTKRKYNNQYSTFRTADTLSFRPNLPKYIRVMSLLAKTSGYAHDFGKASVKFQKKLNNTKENPRDSIRHEWVSLRVLQQLRKGKSWQDAWKEPININFDGFMKNGLNNIIDVLDFCVATHHGLFCKKSGDIDENVNDFHIHDVNYDRTDYLLAGDISNKLLENVKSGEKRLKNILPDTEPLELEYYAWITRAMLIMADHVVSKSYIPTDSEKLKYQSTLLANTKFDDTNKKVPNQSLDYHLTNVGNLASEYVYKFFMDKNYPSISQETIDKLNLNSSDNRFVWQDIGVDYLNSKIKNNILIFNIANTGSGKTLANIKLANAVANPIEPFRLSICLNLRSLTLQTGREYKKVLDLNDSEISVVIGDKLTQKLFDDAKSDEDENDVEPDIEIDDSYESYQFQDLPNWLEDFCSESNNRKTILSSPILVSTVDYLINAAMPSKQGHHVAALLRLASSDLILDEVDGYEPKQLAVIGKMIELSSFFGRNVICSTATLSKHVADIIIVAFNRGKEARQLVIDKNHTSQFSIIDNIIKPTIIDFKDNVLEHYIEQINNKNNSTIADYTKIARLAEVNELDEESWLNSILDSINFHHINQQWQYKNCNVSFGLIRVANTKHGMTVSKFLSENLENARVCFYHAKDFKLARFHKEHALDDLLTRKDINKEYNLIDNIIKDKKEVMFIVVATSVEEIGRDHDFDYSVIEPSSCSSIIQTSGRVNRHRKEKQDLPNISILQYNHRSIAEGITGIRFTRPGLEHQLIGGTTHPIKDLKKLLPWTENNTLEITSELRFNSVFAEYDDNGIIEVTKNIKSKMFADKKLVTLLKNKVYDDYRFRENNNQVLIDLRYEDKADKYYFIESKQEAKNKSSTVNVEAKVDNDWLALSHIELNKLCKTLGVNYYKGKSLSLDKPYENSNLYHNWSFGWYVV